jgi:hypothetical protein
MPIGPATLNMNGGVLSEMALVLAEKILEEHGFVHIYACPSFPFLEKEFKSREELAAFVHEFRIRDAVAKLECISVHGLNGKSPADALQAMPRPILIQILQALIDHSSTQPTA